MIYGNMNQSDLEVIEAEAWEQRESALPQAIKEQLGIRIRRWGRAIALAASGADLAVLNRTIGLGAEADIDAPLLDAIIDFYKDAGVPRWIIDLPPNANVVGGSAAITRRGGVLKTPIVKLFAELRGLSFGAPTNTLSVSEIGPDHADAYRSIVSAAFNINPVAEHDLVSTLGWPGWHHYLAYGSAGQPVAGATMFVSEGGAWFGSCGTLADARNRGAQTALLLTRFADARRLGCSWVTAETAPDTADAPNPSYRNLTRCGMRVAYLREKYLFKPAATDSAS
jgi:GNAT superfamily N-acetyltransferase